MVRTELLYLTDSYAREFDAQVVEVRERNVILDRTLFYPRGGGQMADRGSLSSTGRSCRVIAVERRGQDVVHTIDGRLPTAGERVHGVLDWEFRYTMMRTHSALHVLCGVVYGEFGALVTGCQMYPDRARMDFTLADLTPERVATIERLSNQVARAGHPIRIHFLPRREANLRPELIRTRINLIPAQVDPVRTVEIIGLDLQADGGTHVANTLEIGGLTITKSENKGRENRRLEILLSPLTLD